MQRTAPCQKPRFTASSDIKEVGEWVTDSLTQHTGSQGCAGFFQRKFCRSSKMRSEVRIALSNFLESLSETISKTTQISFWFLNFIDRSW